MKKMFFLVLNLALLYNAEAAELKKINLKFDGRPAAGMEYSFFCRTSRSSSYYMKAPGAKESPLRRDTLEIFLKGKIVCKDSAMKELRFTIESFRLQNNGVRTEFAELKDAVISVVKDAQDKAHAVLLQSAEPNPESDSMNVLGGNENTVSAPVRKLPAEACSVFEYLFSGADWSVKEYLGPNRMAIPGDRWTPNLNVLKQSLQKRGIHIPFSEIQSEIRFKGTDRFLNHPVQRIDLMMQSNNVPGYDFKLSAAMLFNAEQACLPVRMTRSSMEVVTRPLQEGSPLFAGQVLEYVDNEQTDLFFYPAGWNDSGKKNFLFF